MKVIDRTKAVTQQYLGEFIKEIINTKEKKNPKNPKNTKM